MTTENIDAVRDALQREFPNGRVEYVHQHDLHKFKLIGEGRSHWLYLSEELVEDYNRTILINRLKIDGVIDRFQDADRSWHVYLDSERGHVVDEDFPVSGRRPP